uniref:Fibronectin type-III domain-containing protein n=1 Tax=Schistocephalus solidus TaxID=70667 RepID=A0A183SQA2_SCHSO
LRSQHSRSELASIRSMQLTCGNFMKIAAVYMALICTTAIADITDMPSEAICAAQCFVNFTGSLDQTEREFLLRHPDLTEPHCINKQSNCSLLPYSVEAAEMDVIQLSGLVRVDSPVLRSVMERSQDDDLVHTHCLEVCRWPRHNTTSCDESCARFVEKHADAFPNSGPEVQRQTCVGACSFARQEYLETAAILAGSKQAVCPLPSSWPESCQQVCVTDADCHPPRVTRCCQSDVCARGNGGGAGVLRFAGAASQTPPTGVCMQVVTTLEGVPPIPGPVLVRQSEMQQPPSVGNKDPQRESSAVVRSDSANERLYQLELDWPDYYNTSEARTSSDKWKHPAVFLVQLRFFRGLPDATVMDPEQLGGNHQLTETGGSPSEWRSLVWTTKLGAVLSDLQPGTWYQFRLMATSGAGFGGIGPPSQPIKVTSLPEPPSSPSSLTEGTSRIYANKIEVKIKWEEPIYGGDSVKFYRVVRAYTIQDLEPETVYRVQVSAVSVLDSKEWASPAAILYLRTAVIPTKEHGSPGSSVLWNLQGRGCNCESGGANRYFVQPPYFEDGTARATLTLPSSIVSQYFGPSVKETSIFHLLWYPYVCIETQNVKVEVPMKPAQNNVYKASLANFVLTNLRLQCHYKLRIQLAEEGLSTAHQKRVLELCFCTPSCKEVPVKSGTPPKNCSFADPKVPYGPVEVHYRLIPTDPNFRRNIPKHSPKRRPTSYFLSSSSSSPSEVQPVFYSNSGVVHPTSRFDAMVFWKPHPETLNSARRIHEYKSREGIFESGTPLSLVRGYRVIWGPRLIEPIEPGMYNNGMPPQLDPEKTESKVLDLVNSVVLRSLEPATLYIVQVQTIGIHGDSPASSLFFTTPDIAGIRETRSSSGTPPPSTLISNLLPSLLLVAWISPP